MFNDVSTAQNTLVHQYHGEVTTTSLKIAEEFGKRHKNVAQKVRELITDLTNLSAEISADRSTATEHFYETTYLDEHNREQPIFELNRPAYSLLLMRLSGKKVLQRQCAFNDAFYKMEQALTQETIKRASEEYKDARSKGIGVRHHATDAIKAFIEYAKSQGSGSPQRYYINFTRETYKALCLIHGKEKVPKNFRNSLSIMQLQQLSVAEYVIHQVLLEQIEQQVPYKIIFQNVMKKVKEYAKTITFTKLRHVRDLPKITHKIQSNIQPDIEQLTIFETQKKHPLMSA